MRRLLGAFVLAAILAIPFGSAAAAAGPAAQSIELYGGANFNSILGGMSSGTAALSGSISNDEIGALRGSVNFPLRDLSITVSPTTTITLVTERLTIGWNRWTCDQFGCTSTYGSSTFEWQRAQGPVTLRAGSLHGSGTLSLQTTAVCVADCPPAGAYYSAPYGSFSVNGGLTSANEAGYLNINGGAPVIH